MTEAKEMIAAEHASDARVSGEGSVVRVAVSLLLRKAQAQLKVVRLWAPMVRWNEQRLVI